MPEKDGANVDLDLKKWRACDDLGKLRTRVHRAMRAAETVMYAAGKEGDRACVLKAATTMQQTARTYLKVLEADELLERIEALEAAQERQQSNGTVFNRN